MGQCNLFPSQNEISFPKTGNAWAMHLASGVVRVVRPLYLTIMTTDTFQLTSAPLYIGIDVGTGSARAALSTRDGTLLATSSYDIKTWRDPKGAFTVHL